MATKTISIMDDVYELIINRKRRDQSFSDFLRKVLGKRDIMAFAGAWSHINEKDIEDLKKNIEEHDIKETRKLLKKYKK